jgi:hypothetical protein
MKISEVLKTHKGRLMTGNPWLNFSRVFKTGRRTKHSSLREYRAWKKGMA